MVSLKELEKWLSTTQAAHVLGWSRQGVINLAKQKRVRAVRTACGWLYDPESVENFTVIERGRQNGQGKSERDR